MVQSLLHISEDTAQQSALNLQSTRATMDHARPPACQGTLFTPGACAQSPLRAAGTRHTSSEASCSARGAKLGSCESACLAAPWLADESNS